jgi:hypothetical protein
MGAGDSFEQKHLGEVLSLITPALKKADPPVAVFVPCTWPTVVQLEYTFTRDTSVSDPGNGWWVPGPRLTEWIIAEHAARRARDDPLPLDLPDGCVPRDYQVDGARSIAYSGRFLVLDDPGTGKSCTTILGLAWRQHLGHDIFPAAVVVPSWGVARAWEREIAQWMPSWRTALWTGSKRAELAGTADVYLVTYATARRDAADTRGPLVKLKPKAVVADEVHWIGNPKAHQTKAVQRIASRVTTFAGLSGTVIRTDVRDLWPPLKAMDSRSWPSGKRLTNRYCIQGHPDYGSAIEGLEPLREPEFRDTLLGAMRRVAKADVLTQLPPKIYSVRRIAMPDDWRKAYDDMETDMLAELPDGQQLPAFDVLTRMNHLSQMASSAFDVKVTEGPDVDEITGELKKHYHVILREPCWKADELMEIMEERRGSAPIVAFAPSKQLMMLAGLRAAKQGYRVGYYVGLGRHPDHADWPAVSEKSRARDFDAFQAGQLDLLCVTTKAGGTGLTLTAAGTAVFLRRPWELDDAIQAEDRVHRIGSEIHAHGVEIIDVRTIKTVETRVVERLREKGANLAELVQDPRIARELMGGS